MIDFNLIKIRPKTLPYSMNYSFEDIDYAELNHILDGLYVTSNTVNVQAIPPTDHEVCLYCGGIKNNGCYCIDSHVHLYENNLINLRNLRWRIYMHHRNQYLFYRTRLNETPVRGLLSKDHYRKNLLDCYIYHKRASDSVKILFHDF